MSFTERLSDEIDRKDGVVCVGLDPIPERIPEGVGTREFLHGIVDATGDVATAFKPNAAFFEALDAWDLLLDVCATAQAHAPVILDAKRADVGHSSARYAELLDHADAITVNPYLGEDSLRPFLDRTDKGVFVLCRTSNPGAADFQALESNGLPLYGHVARRVAMWDDDGDAGLVVGATAPEELEEVRGYADDLPFLVPGIGAQGGDAEAAVEHGLNVDGVGLVNSTRSIIYARDDAEGYADAAREAAKKLRRRLNAFR